VQSILSPLILYGMKKVKTEIRDVSSTGEGIGSTEDGVLFVDEALSGEEVLAEVILKKRNYSKGKLLEILTPSKHRIDPPCPYFGSCGGCQIQHADKVLQEEIKRDRVKESLKRIAKESEDKIEEFVSSPNPFGYRNKIILPLLFQNGKKKVGFFKKRSHDLVEIESCLLHVPFADKIYQKIKELLYQSKVTFYDEKRNKGSLQHLVIRSSDHEQKVLVGLIGVSKLDREIEALCREIYSIEGVKGVVFGKKMKAQNSIYPEKETVVCGEGFLIQEILGVKIKTSLLSFFQVNRDCAEKMYRKTFEIAGLKEGDKVLDGYCGIGSFAIYLASCGFNVTGIENFAPAVEDAKINSELNHQKVDFLLDEVEKSSLELKGFDCVFINPPRKGVHIDVIEKLSSEGVSKIVYTSCDPATLSRDVFLLKERGYELKKVILFDMFPQTVHVESVALIEKNCC